MITDNDIKKLKAVFATKDDLIAMEKRQDTRFATKDDLQGMESRIKKDIKKVKDSLDLAIGVFDKQGVYHHKRLVNLEKKTGLGEQPPSAPIN